MIFKPRQKGSSLKNLLKLKDGEFYVGVFRGEPSTFYQHWVGNHSDLCTRNDEGGCEHCRNGDKGSYRFRVNIIGNEGGDLVARVFEGGAKVYDQLVGLGQEYDLANHRVKISRSGSDKSNTTYSIVPAKDGLLSKELAEKYSRVTLTPFDGSEAPLSNEDIPF